MKSRIRFAGVRPAAAASAALALLGAAAAVAPLSSSAAPSVGGLQSRIGQQRARAQSLAASTGRASELIAQLDGQIAQLAQREAALQVRLAAARAALGEAQAAVTRERAHVALLEARLARARMLLARQLVSQYEAAPQNVVTVVLQAHGFADLLDRLQYLHMAQGQQQAIVRVTTAAKAQAVSAVARLARLESRDRASADAVATEAAAIAGMDGLLQGKRTAVQRVRAIQLEQLASARARQAQLSHQLSVVEAQQAAAATNAAGGPALGPSGGWAIPYSIVLCESGGQNLPPNSAGASGYYQIIPSTWSGAGGTGPAAYLAPKSEQDRIASMLWNNGAGASNWVCAGILGIH
jgi:hypothetical protein